MIVNHISNKTVALGGVVSMPYSADTLSQYSTWWCEVYRHGVAQRCRGGRRKGVSRNIQYQTSRNRLEKEVPVLRKARSKVFTEYRL